MQTDYLRYFIDVATLGSMNAAAKKNFMTPQGISRSIAALESEFGCELFKRDSNKVSLTHFGEALLGSARDIVKRENELRRSVAELRSEQLRKRTMRFTCYGSPIFFDTPLLFPASGFNTALYGKVQFLQRATPRVVELLCDAARITQPEIVVAGGLGFYEMFADENARMIASLLDAGYEYRPFMRTCDYVLVPAFSTMAQSEALSKAEIRSFPLAVSVDGDMERAVAQHIGSDSVFASSGDSGFRSHLCRMGEALTFVPGVSLAFDLPEGTEAVPMEEPYTIEIGFAARSAAFREGVLAEVIERLDGFYSQCRKEGAFELLDGSLASSSFVPA